MATADLRCTTPGPIQKSSFFHRRSQVEITEMPWEIAKKWKNDDCFKNFNTRKDEIMEMCVCSSFCLVGQKFGKVTVKGVMLYLLLFNQFLWKVSKIRECGHSKNHFGHSLAFDAPTVWNHLPDEVRSAPTLACFRKRLKIISLQKGISNLAYTLSAVSVVLDLATAMDRWFFEFDFGVVP